MNMTMRLKEIFPWLDLLDVWFLCWLNFFGKNLLTDCLIVFTATDLPHLRAWRWRILFGQKYHNLEFFGLLYQTSSLSSKYAYHISFQVTDLNLSLVLTKHMDIPKTVR